jgi:hypothetical protein
MVICKVGGVTIDGGDEQCPPIPIHRRRIRVKARWRGEAAARARSRRGCVGIVETVENQATVAGMMLVETRPVHERRV